MPALFPRSTAVPCSFLPELEPVLWAAVTFGTALGKHPNISVTIPAMDDCPLPRQWSQINLVACKKQWQNSVHFSSFRRILRNPVVLSYLFPSPTSLLSAWDYNGFFTVFSPRACGPFIAWRCFCLNRRHQKPSVVPCLRDKISLRGRVWSPMQ